jgi:hypothetical protein
VAATARASRAGVGGWSDCERAGPVTEETQYEDSEGARLSTVARGLGWDEIHSR